MMSFDVKQIIKGEEMKFIAKIGVAAVGVAFVCAAFGEPEAASVQDAAPAKTPATAAVTTPVAAPAVTPAAVQQPPQQEIKVVPGAVLCVWQGKNMTEAELCSLVDSGKVFSDRAADVDEAGRMARARTLKWSGILNFEQPGLYTFNGVTGIERGETTAELIINGVSVLKFEGSGVQSKNVQIPGPVNAEVVMYNGWRNCSMQLKLRCKKAGTITYKEITPADFFHGAE